MFEKEAEEYLKKLLKRLKIKEKDLAENQPEIQSWEKMNFVSLDVSNVSKAFQKGAEFGYNKINEWHYVKDGMPKESKKYYVYSKQWGVEVRKFFADVGYFECRKNDVIAWKEIVLPELKE